MNKQEYLFVCLAEEAAEIAHATDKILRFGIFDHHPKTNDVYNIELLQQEIIDLHAVLGLLATQCLIDLTEIPEDRVKEKQKKIYKYMRYAEECRTLSKDT